ncbi:MAG: MarR family transcriptional regulator [Clostridia bacterium]|nr:MarR family transcriptional regulator [Clostridia bacterium]
MDKYSEALNQALTETYNNVMCVESEALKRSGRIHLSINEMHLIECVGKTKDGCTLSEIASGLNIARPSATVAVNKLAKKGYVTKTACADDGRSVKVFLTREGQKIDAYHRYYHRHMVRELTRDLSDEEKAVLLSAAKKLNEFFKQSIGEF